MWLETLALLNIKKMKMRNFDNLQEIASSCSSEYQHLDLKRK